MRVLIAEDDIVSRKLLATLLEKWGYEPVVACDGEQALAVLRREDTPRLVVLDWMMPYADGIQVCQEIRRHGDIPYIYVILLTAKSSKKDIIDGLDAGADDYVMKPFDAGELKVRLRAGQRILDLQEELLSTKVALHEQATHDPLIGLPNRLLFSDRLNQGLSNARKTGRPLAIMFLDLDRFKLVNDTLGHNTGDLLLKKVAERLTYSLRDVDMIARMGGDEFTMLLSNISSPDDASRIADRILQVLSEPLVLEGHEMVVSGSIGISIFPADGDDAETLVKNADTAMYRAKEMGRNNYQFYTETLNMAVLKRMTLENSLRKALEREEFVVHYQPRVNVNDGEIMGMEALIRWQKPESGLVYPAQFIPLAEETGLIVQIGEWVLRTACVQNRKWHDAGLAALPVAVNISARQFHQNDLVWVVKDALKSAGLEPRYLELELTESALMHNTDQAVRALNELRELGVRISLDDFGIGHSSLGYLKRFPVNTVKIDQSFVRDITTDPDDAAIAGAVVAMAHSLKLNVIAEGVETLQQLEFLRSLNCDEMQGYFVSRPIPPDEFLQFLNKPNHLLCMVDSEAA
ncbi:MAG: EAL domain-containing protein [Armatimonadota bacterium]